MELRADGPVRVSVEDGVAVVDLDDGKANALGHATVEALHEALDRSSAEARALVVAGRPGCFSGGFDLGEMQAGPERARALVRAGGELTMRLYGHPQPVVAAVTGHCVAAGALLALAADVRIGSSGSSRIGLNEVAIGLAMPTFGVELARDRLTPTAVREGLLGARLYDPDAAAAAGFLDEVVDARVCRSRAIEEARRLGGFRSGAYAGTKARLRRETVTRVLDGLAADMAALNELP